MGESRGVGVEAGREGSWKGRAGARPRPWWKRPNGTPPHFRGRPNRPCRPELSEADADAPGKSEGFGAAAGLDEGEQEIAKGFVAIEGQLTPCAAVRVVLDKAGHGELGRDVLAEIDGLSMSRGPNTRIMLFLRSTRPPMPTPTPRIRSSPGQSVALHSWMIASIICEKCALAFGNASPRLGQYLAGRIDDDGDVETRPGFQCRSRGRTSGSWPGEWAVCPRGYPRSLQLFLLLCRSR